MNRAIPEAVNACATAIEAAKVRSGRDITEQEGAIRLSELPGVDWINVQTEAGNFVKLGMPYTPLYRATAHAPSGGPEMRTASDVSLRDAVERLIEMWMLAHRKAEREKVVRERVEREMREVEAAEAAERFDGVPADTNGGVA